MTPCFPLLPLVYDPLRLTFFGGVRIPPLTVANYCPPVFPAFLLNLLHLPFLLFWQPPFSPNSPPCAIFGVLWPLQTHPPASFINEQRFVLRVDLVLRGPPFSPLLPPTPPQSPPFRLFTRTLAVSWFRFGFFFFLVIFLPTFTPVLPS